jgi:hypothetical protein
MSVQFKACLHLLVGHCTSNLNSNEEFKYFTFSDEGGNIAEIEWLLHN